MPDAAAVYPLPREWAGLRRYGFHGLSCQYALRRTGELQRSLVDPDAEIVDDNRFARVVTRGGETITGRLLNQDSFSIQLFDAKERLLSFTKSDLREYAILKSSPMPSYRETLTTEELADVVSYLRALKGRP